MHFVLTIICTYSFAFIVVLFVRTMQTRTASELLSTMYASPVLEANKIDHFVKHAKKDQLNNKQH